MTFRLFPLLKMSLLEDSILVVVCYRDMTEQLLLVS
jgi:hypothetical protein